MGKIYRQAVMAVLVNDENKTLIGYSPRDKSYKFPQGGIHPNESVISCIKRELKEELNYNLEDSFVINTYKQTVKYLFPPDVHPVFKGQELHIVKIKYDNRLELTPQDDEFDTLIWVKPDEILKFNSQYRAKAYIEALIICGLIIEKS